LAYWEVVRALPADLDVAYVISHSDVIESKVVERWLLEVARVKPEWAMAVIVTGSGDAVPDEAQIPDQVSLVDLGAIAVRYGLDTEQQLRLLGTVLVQYAPDLVHVVASPLGAEVIDRYDSAMAPTARRFITGAVPSGSRLPEHAAPLSMPSRTFVPLPYVRESRLARRRKILWQGDISSPRLLGVLAAVAEGLANEGLDAPIYLYGDLDPSRLDGVATLARLYAHGSVAHPPIERDPLFSSFDDFAIYLSLDESGRVSEQLLKVCGAAIPVVGSAQGVLTESIGYPVDSIESVDEIVAAIAAALTDPGEAERRAHAARKHVIAGYTQEAVARLAREPGYLGVGA